MIPTSYERLPDTVQGFTVYDEFNEYLIIINQNLAPEIQSEFYLLEESKINKGIYVEEVLRSAHLNKKRL